MIVSPKSRGERSLTGLTKLSLTQCSTATGSVQTIPAVPLMSPHTAFVILASKIPVEVHLPIVMELPLIPCHHVLYSSRLCYLQVYTFVIYSSVFLSSSSSTIKLFSSITTLSYFFALPLSRGPCALLRMKASNFNTFALFLFSIFLIPVTVPSLWKKSPNVTTPVFQLSLPR